MAAPWARLFQKRACLTGIATSVRQYSCVTQALPSRVQCKAISLCNNQHSVSSKSSIDALSKRLADQCMLGQSSNRPFSSLTTTTNSSHVSSAHNNNLSRSSALLQSTVTHLVQPKRTIISYSMGKAKKKSVKAVTARFYRFNSGLWLRCRAGRNKKLWNKSAKRKARIKQFVFCSGNQSKKLDKMVTAYWKRQKHIPDDPFAPFENRNWYGHKEFPGGHYVKHMEKKNAPLNMPYKKL